MPPLNPPPVISAGLALITQQFVLSSIPRPSIVTFALVTGGATLADAQDIVDDFQANFNTQWQPPLSVSCALPPPTIRLGVGTTTPFEAVAAGAAGAGAGVIVLPPPNTAVLIKKSTGVGGKKNRGRSYYPYMVDEGNINAAGMMTAGQVAGFQARATAFLAQLVADGTPMCIANKGFNVPLPPHHVITIDAGPQVTTYGVEAQVATQRRRLRS